MGIFFKKKKKEEPAITPTAPKFFNENTYYKLQGIDIDLATLLAKKTAGFPFDYDELKGMYDIGDKVYEYELYANTDRLSLERDGDKFFIFIDGKKIAYVTKQKTEEIQRIITEYGIKRMSLEIAFGRCQTVEKNDNPDTETYGEDDNKWITSDYIDKPKGKIMIGYDRPWVTLGETK